MKPRLAHRPATADAIASLSSHLQRHTIKVPNRVERPVVLPAADADAYEDEDIRIALAFIRLRSRKS